MWRGESLSPDDFISADEKTSIQARYRKHATAGLQRGSPCVWSMNTRGPERSCTWLPGMSGVPRCSAGASPRAVLCVWLIADVMTQEPYASARRVFWVVDNGSSHRGERATKRLAKRWPNAILVHLPVHASWLNQMRSTSRSSSGRCSGRTISTLSLLWKTVFWELGIHFTPVAPRYSMGHGSTTSPARSAGRRCGLPPHL
jgi:hypothetical protein